MQCESGRGIPGTNPCISHLMAAPDEAQDSLDWLSHTGSVVAFSPDGDMLPADVLKMWKFALCVDPGNFDSHEAFSAMFTPDVYAAFERTGQLPGEG